MLEKYEARLDSFHAAERMDALEKLTALVRAGEIARPHEKPVHNLHGHSFFSYNCYGFSPAHFAWVAARGGFEAAGLVDFDVLDGLEEFHAAGRLLDLRTVVSVESRTFVPEFATRVTNSPGEPGISYHMAVGFPGQPAHAGAARFLHGMRANSERRNRDLLARVNAFLAPAAIDYDKDVLPLTPKGNATERHIVLAYARKAAALFPDATHLAAFWAAKLGSADGLDLPDGPKLLNLLRSKTMKKGGVGYVQPGRESFPLMADMNRFALQCGAMPAVAWFDGASEGEQAMEELLRVAMSTGAAALNIIPDRNYTPGKPDQRLRNLHDVVALADRLDLPVIVGTELNSAGQKLVDDFDTAEIKPLVASFRRGWQVVYGHTVLQRVAGLGYCGEWAERNLPARRARNDFYSEMGRSLRPSTEDRISGAGPASRPADILKMIG